MVPSSTAVKTTSDRKTPTMTGEPARPATKSFWTGRPPAERPSSGAVYTGLGSGQELSGVPPRVARHAVASTALYLR